jgi:hypothetical protein
MLFVLQREWRLGLEKMEENGKEVVLHVVQLLDGTWGLPKLSDRRFPIARSGKCEQEV